MRGVFTRIKKYMLPQIDTEVIKNVDTESVYNIYRVTLVVMIFETITLLAFYATRKVIDRAALISIFSVLACVLFSGVTFLWSGYMIKRAIFSHAPVNLLKIVCFLYFSLWSIIASFRQYIRGEQMLTFYAAELMLVCFVSLEPMASVILNLVVYLFLFGFMHHIDGCHGINIFNYVALLIVSMVSMVVRYHSQVNMAQKSVQLERNNDLLEYTGRHDGLTGIRNRLALDEDVVRLSGRDVTCYMLDINYFKEINDNYGHTVGDVVLREAASQIKSRFSDSRCYRYGGDEFLVISTGKEAKDIKTFTFRVPEIPDHDILVSIGKASGTPLDPASFFGLIAKADEGLYEIKRLTHSPEYGGHERRHSS